MTLRWRSSTRGKTELHSAQYSISYWQACDEALNMKIHDHVRRQAVNLAWAHAVVFSVIALACYVSPETVFGEAAWLPLARLAVLLFAAALVSAAIVLIGSAWSGTLRQISLALLAGLVLDVQIPILLFSQPASMEYLHSELGIPWFVVPSSFFVIVGVTVHFFLRIRRGTADV
jgi:hypothetical protein